MRAASPSVATEITTVQLLLRIKPFTPTVCSVGVPRALLARKYLAS